MIPTFEAEIGLHVTYINTAGGPLQARLYPRRDGATLDGGVVHR